ncbi:unnamed protein product [Amaranthus hypochondriacus]
MDHSTHHCLPSSTPKDTQNPQELRLLISYNGQILPNPHNNTLFYANGTTRFISIPKTTVLSLSTLFSHISKRLFNGTAHNFTLKYQLPHHDLDSLISIASDEDLLNMIDEYDRNSSLKCSAPKRIRFFLFVKEDDGDDWFGDEESKVAGSNNGEENSGECTVLESNLSFGSTKSSDSNCDSNCANKDNVNGGGSGSGIADDLKIALHSLDFDSIGSDLSLPSPHFSPQAVVYQDPLGIFDSKPAFVNLIETETNASNCSRQIDIPSPIQVLIPGYTTPKPINQPEHQSSPRAQYINHQASQSNCVAQNYLSSIPLAYPPMYPTGAHPQQHYQYYLNKPYPVYMMPVGQTQNPYGISMMRSSILPPNASTRRPQTPSMVYEGYEPINTTQSVEQTQKTYETSMMHISTTPPNASISRPQVPSMVHDGHKPINTTQSIEQTQNPCESSMMYTSTTPPNDSISRPRIPSMVYEGYKPINRTQSVEQTQNPYGTSMTHPLTTPPNASNSWPQIPLMVYEGYKPMNTTPEYAGVTQPLSLPSMNQPAQPITPSPIEKFNFFGDYEDPMRAQIYKTQPSGPSPTSSSQLQMLPERFSQLQMENTSHQL